MPIVLASLSGVSLIGMCTILISVKRIFQNAEILEKDWSKGREKENTSLSVIIPVFNEEKNIETCISSVINSECPCKKWDIIIADDGSTDNTIQITRDIKERLKGEKNNLKIINAGPRPIKERWVGKNWACSRAIKHTDSQWLLFLDADVEVNKSALKRALKKSIYCNIDLLSLAPKISCNCLSEWMVQPIIATLLAIGFPIKKTNNPNNQIAFAAGPFMLFKKSTYDDIGGHENVADEVVEDIALARKVKSSGYNLKFLLGLDAVRVRMYSNLSELWEGWTKNWYLGLDKSIIKSLSASLVVFWIFSIPWIILLLSGIYIGFNGNIDNMMVICYLYSITAILLQFSLRKWYEDVFDVPSKLWYLMGIGGIIIGCIGPASIIKSITGRGWTWKGRSLS